MPSEQKGKIKKNKLEKIDDSLKQSPRDIAVKCVHCGAENNLGFVLYYKDKCWNCDKEVYGK